MKITRTFTKTMATIEVPNEGFVDKEYIGLPTNKVLATIKKEFPDSVRVALSYSEVKREMDVETFIANSTEVQ